MERHQSQAFDSTGRTYQPLLWSRSLGLGTFISAIPNLTIVYSDATPKTLSLQSLPQSKDSCCRTLYSTQQSQRAADEEIREDPVEGEVSRGTPGLPLLHGFPLFPGEVTVLLELVGKENTVMASVLQEVSQFVVLSATQGTEQI